MKRLLSLALFLALLLTLAPPAAASPAVPAPPPWVKAEEYAVFADGAAYEPETWSQITRLRADAAAGHTAPVSGSSLYGNYTALGKSSAGSIRFEYGLLALKYACNAAAAGKGVSSLPSSFELAAYSSFGDEPARYTAYLWNARCKLINMRENADMAGQGAFCAAVKPLLAYDAFTMDSLLQGGWMTLVSASKIKAVRSILFVTLDGELVHPRIVYSGATREETSAHVASGRTMVPVRRLAELMGAAVTYSKGTVTMTRAADTIVMTIGSKAAAVNGKPLAMDVSPYIIKGRTYIPVRFMAEFFGQSVDWVGAKQQVRIRENRAAVSPSNLESWAMPMGAMLNYIGHFFQDNTLPAFGGKSRFGAKPVGSGVTNALDTTGPDYGRSILTDSWSINSRAKLITTVTRMTAHGHNGDFLRDAAYISSLSAAEYQKILADATETDAYMFPYTKQLGAKWGSRGILCWDLFRMSNLVQWGYLAGYVTYPEALALLEPAARALHDNFTSWDQAYENYLDGYNWWARNNVLGTDVWTTARGVCYQEMKASASLKAMFDDSLFKTPVVGVPNLTAAGLLQSAE
jgi:hypothetical protein